MSVRSLRAAVRRTPVLLGAAALSMTLMTACGDDTVDDDLEQEVGEVGEEVEGEVGEVEGEVEEEVDE